MSRAGTVRAPAVGDADVTACSPSGPSLASESRRFALRPTGAGALVTPYGKACRLRDAKQAVKDRFHAQYQKLLADMEAELREIDRRFWAGELR